MLQGPVAAAPEPVSLWTRAGELRRGRGLLRMKAQGLLGRFLWQKPDVVDLGGSKNAPLQ